MSSPAKGRYFSQLWRRRSLGSQGQSVPMNLRIPHRLRSLAWAAASLLLCCGEAGAACSLGGGEPATAASVTERGEIVLADGRTLRLAGLDIPDSSRGEPENAASARAWLSSRLIGRQIGVRLLSARTDRWGRWIADVSAPGDGAPTLISLGLLSAGLARVRPEAEARGCLPERLAAEQAAREDGLGLWTDPYYGVVEASDLDDLRQRDGQFAIVEGVVLRVGAGRDRTWLDFGRRGSFSAVVTARQAKAFERDGVLLSDLVGARVRVRGAMDNRFGLRMAISEADEIEQSAQPAVTRKAKPDE